MFAGAIRINAIWVKRIKLSIEQNIRRIFLLSTASQYWKKMLLIHLFNHRIFHLVYFYWFVRIFVASIHDFSSCLRSLVNAITICYGFDHFRVGNWWAFILFDTRENGSIFIWRGMGRRIWSKMASLNIGFILSVNSSLIRELIQRNFAIMQVYCIQ